MGRYTLSQPSKLATHQVASRKRIENLGPDFHCHQVQCSITDFVDDKIRVSNKIEIRKYRTFIGPLIGF
jgi:hypothetical protein